MMQDQTVMQVTCTTFQAEDSPAANYANQASDCASLPIRSELHLRKFTS